MKHGKFWMLLAAAAAISSALSILRSLQQGIRDWFTPEAVHH